jgi:signal transduction histidine kinase
VIARLALWQEERPVAADAVLAALIAAFAVANELTETSQPLAGLAFSLALAACVPWRRRAPVAMFVAVSVLCLAQFAVLERIAAGDVVALVALYTLVAYSSLGALGTACSVVGALLAALRWDGSAENVSLGQVAATTVVSVLLAAALGAWRRSRRTELAALRERTRLLAVERDQQAALERARIARELHDVVAHSLSVIVVQADGAAAAAAQRPEQAVGALNTIGDTAREALGQMRRLLGVLRERDEAELTPQPGVAQLDALVEQVARAGVPAHLAREGHPRDVAGEVDLTLYRVAQEALTNVIKHAGPVSRVDVVLRYQEDAVELHVRDDGRGGQTTDGRGQGLVGMRERVGLHDGTLEAGPNEQGFEVRAVVAA